MLSVAALLTGCAKEGEVQDTEKKQEDTVLTILVQQSGTNMSGTWEGESADRLYEETGIRLEFYSNGNGDEKRLKQYLAAGEKVTLVGWFENIRKVSKNLGFVILRDFYGTTQIVVETEDLMEQFSAINTESTIEVTGTVRERSSKNPKLATGDIEVVPETVKVLGKCQYQELPFQINRSKEADENTRLKYRYLDLRNPEVKSKIVLRSKIVADLRSAMVAHDFMEITTPILTCSSPEGARDYLVPARKHPGKFYALPQAPQQFKQLLMASLFPDCSLFQR